MLEPGSPPRLLTDVMLGRLARWLRALGYDTVYFRDMDDASLTRRALAQDRILLTRDRELARRRGLRVLLIADDRVEAQLRQVVRELGLSPDNPFSRCLLCNVPLADLEREQARDLVAPYVYATQLRFRRCPQCGKVYWRGTHWAHMRAALEEVETGRENGI